MTAIARARPPHGGSVARIRIVAIAMMLATWEVMARSGLFYEGIMPPLGNIAAATVAEAISAGFYRDLGITLVEAGLGFVAGSVIAIAIGIQLGLDPYVRRAVEPYLNALGGTPKIIFLPILFLLFGLGIESKIAKGALSAFFPVVYSATLGIVGIRPILLRVGRSFRLNRRQMAMKIYLPAMVEPVVAGLRLGLAMAIIGILAAEIKYSDGGLGHRLAHYADGFKIASMYATVILIFAVAIGLNAAISRLQRRLGRGEASRAGPLGAA